MDIKNSIHILTSDGISDETLKSWLCQVNENIPFLERKNENIVNFILMLNWAERNEDVRQCYSEVVLNLVTAYDIYLRSVLKMIIKNFVPVSNEESGVANPSVHQLLQRVCQLIPLAQSVLLPMLADSFPYMKKSVAQQTIYLKNLFHMTSYLSSCRPAVLEMVIIKLLQIDVHCPRDAILDWRENLKPPDGEPVFVLETETPKEEEDNQHPLANILDVLLNEVFKYIQTTCFIKNAGVQTDELDWESTKKLYKELLSVFDAVILPTHACAHVQYIMFYLCSFRALLCEGFIDYLWKKVQNPNVSPVIRQGSSCYIGSLLSRAKYVPIRMVQDCLKLMCSWINSYIDNQSESSYTNSDAAHHSTFYAVCQVVFYLVTFRHKEMVFNRKGQHVLKELNLERIVNCRFNPLRNCLPVVIKNFSTVARNYQIAYCNTIIERNNRLFAPVNSQHSSVDLASFITLETFFPFDPFLLLRSGNAIEPLYREYEGHAEPAQVEHDESEMEGSPMLGSPQSPPFMFDISSSPGYRQKEFR